MAVTVLLFVVGACDQQVCAGADCGPNDPPQPGEPQGPPWDDDGDSISNATETHAPNAIYGFRIDTVDLNPSRSQGLPNGGAIDSAINIPNSGEMFVQYLQSYDTQEMPDWGILRLINVVEGAGRRFAIPLGFAGACRIYSDWTPFPRIQVGHLSLQHGGPFIVANQQRHSSHQNGLDVDIRYLRNDTQEIPLNLASSDSTYFDQDRTIDLLRCFTADPRVDMIFYDSTRTGIVNDALSAGRLRHEVGHSDHFHVRVRAP